VSTGGFLAFAELALLAWSISGPVKILTFDDCFYAERDYLFQ
jgi:hypothetical protein